MDYRALIIAAANRHGVPANLALAVAQKESSMQQYAANGKVLSRYESHLGEYSLGLFQLLQSTARDMGVDPNDPVQNIEGGVKYLAWLNRMTGGRNDWEAVLQAYNGGIGRWQAGTTTTPAKQYAVSVLTMAGMQPGSVPVYNPPAYNPTAPTHTAVADPGGAPNSIPPGWSTDLTNLAASLGVRLPGVAQPAIPGGSDVLLTQGSAGSGSAGPTDVLDGSMAIGLVLLVLVAAVAMS